jgi:SAM-dependent methyltransferase
LNKLQSVHKIIKIFGELRAEDMWRNTREVLNKYIRPDQKILDVGVGLGQTTKTFSEKLHLNQKNIFSIDLGNVLMEESLKKGYSLAEGEKIPFEASTFDTTLFIDMLHHTKAPEELLLEGVRTTKQNGYIVLLENLLGDRWTDQKREKLYSFDNTWNSQSDGTNPHSNHTLSEWKKIGESLGLEFIESVEWQWGKIDFVPGATRIGDRKKPSKLRPFTDSVMIFRVKEKNPADTI